MHITVIIPCYHHDFELEKCLEGLACQDVNSSFSYEVIVVNNNPHKEIVLKHDHQLNLKIINEKKTGSYAARNAGIKVANGDILAFTDADCIPSSRWLINAWHVFSTEKIDRLTGPVHLISKENPGASEIYESLMEFKQHDYFLDGWSTTANLFVKKYVFDKVGVFDERHYSGEDQNWNQKKANRHKLGYHPEVAVHHPARNNRNYILRVKRTYQVEFNRIKSKGRFILFLHGLILLFPPIRSWLMLIRENSNVKDVKSLKVMSFAYFRKLHLFHEHFRLFFNGTPRHL